MRYPVRQERKEPAYTASLSAFFPSFQETSHEPKDGRLTTEFTEIIDIIRAHRVFLSHFFGYYSVPTVVNTFLRMNAA